MPSIEDALRSELKTLVPPQAVASIVRSLPNSAHAETGTLDLVRAQELLAMAVAGVQLFNAQPPADAAARLRRSITGGRATAPTRTVIHIASDHDVLAAQSAAQRLMKGVFKPTDCIRVATAVSELTRNIYMYAGSGTVTLEVREEEPSGATFSVLAEDRGKGITNLEAIFAGKYRSNTGLGRGLIGAKALLDTLSVETGPHGTIIRGVRRTRLSYSQ
jgi:anti-sigma regulatory factor (Ser/Thr protein kinase)